MFPKRFLLINNMLLHCGLLMLCLSCATSTENIYNDSTSANYLSRFAVWPSLLNGANMHRIRRATVNASVDQPTAIVGPNEGGNLQPPGLPADILPPTSSKNDSKETKGTDTHVDPITTQGKGDATPNSQANDEQKNAPIVEAVQNPSTTQLSQAITTPANNASLNGTITEKAKPLNLNNPGMVMRGFIVFGGFLLMAAAYFIFFKRKNKNNDTGSSIGLNDANQFRYGVLQSEDMKDNIESTRIPLTLDSEDEVDDDLEIFDLMQKKKSLSYVNLQQNDEEIVLSPRDTVDIEGDNLLLDIEDASSDTLINWSNNGSKSIL